MNAKELADKLAEHPDAEVRVSGDDMSSSLIESIDYDAEQNVFWIYQD